MFRIAWRVFLLFFSTSTLLSFHVVIFRVKPFTDIDFFFSTCFLSIFIFIISLKAFHVCLPHGIKLNSTLITIQLVQNVDRWWYERESQEEKEKAFHVLFHIQFNCDCRQGADSNFSTHKKASSFVPMLYPLMVGKGKSGKLHRFFFSSSSLHLKILLRYCDTNWTSTYLICKTFYFFVNGRKFPQVFPCASFWIFNCFGALIA